MVYRSRPDTSLGPTYAFKRRPNLNQEGKTFGEVRPRFRAQRALLKDQNIAHSSAQDTFRCFIPNIPLEEESEVFLESSNPKITAPRV
ncbi:hypothetical protein VNO78_18102 [Psophocarpus tetragonolobus]|uniref:Uncharacterized protein n=1 Tax=Psophocarpus tetragonolobus TaxID=3891 RepID=A0AAN9SHV2_PSOTE